MDRQSRQFEYEKKWSQAFLDRINEENGSDYIAQEYDNKKTPKWADVDMEAISTSGKYPSLYLQLTRDDRFSEMIITGTHKTPVFNCDNIQQAINEKIAKYTKGGKDFSEIILLVQGTLSEDSVPFEITDELIKKCNNYKFKGIYYLSAPNLTNSKGITRYVDWFIKELKKFQIS